MTPRDVALLSDQAIACARSRCGMSALMRWSALIDPVIADLQCEYAAALDHGRLWRARWIQVEGYVAFAKVIGVHAATGTLMRNGPGAEANIIGRTTVIAALWIGALTAFFVGLPFQQPIARHATAGEFAWLVAYLLPQALVVALPLGIAGRRVGRTGGRADHTANRDFHALPVDFLVCRQFRCCGMGDARNEPTIP